MKRILFSDFKMLEKQSTDLEKFEKLEKKLKQEIKAKSQLESELNDQIRINKKETLKREMILREIRKKKNYPWQRWNHLEIQPNNWITGFQVCRKARRYM